MRLTRYVVTWVAFVLVFTGSAWAQGGWSTPQANSPQVIALFMRFHLQVADAIKSRREQTGEDVSGAVLRTLGVSAAEFDKLTNSYRSILAARAAARGRNLASSVSGRPGARERLLIDGFGGALGQISPGSAGKILTYMNGPFRARVRSKQGGKR